MFGPEGAKGGGANGPSGGSCSPSSKRVTNSHLAHTEPRSRDVWTTSVFGIFAASRTYELSIKCFPPLSIVHLELD